MTRTMISLLFLIWVFINSISAQQHYDSSECSEESSSPGSRYTCSSVQSSCKTFLVYRASQDFQTPAQICDLFQKQPDNKLLRFNKLSSASEILQPGREIIVPIDCYCSGNYFQADFSYIVTKRKLYLEIACGVFEGLLNLRTPVNGDPYKENVVEVGVRLDVPLKCACPDNFTSAFGIKYLVTYPFLEGDTTVMVSQKFGTSPQDLWAVNSLDPQKPTIYPSTTALVPLKTEPALNLSVQISQPPSPGFLPTITVENSSFKKLRILYISGSVVGLLLVVVALIACGLYAKALRKWKHGKLQSFNYGGSSISCSTARSSPRSGQTGRSSTNSCLSPDLLVGIKFSMYNYSLQDIKRATKDFSEDNTISEQAYRGLIDNVEVMIKQMKFEDTRRVIDVHSKINHINIVNLHGVCYGENDLSWSYLMFEYPSNGCLRDKLSDPFHPLKWERRTQIAFDVATGLHYLHHCIFPSYAHMCINSRNIFVTTNWRAKLANVEASSPASTSRGNGWIAPEYIAHGSASEKVDIFAFGVVLLELISGREDVNGKGLQDSIGFLGGVASEGGCFDQLRSFMDPSLKQDYPLAEALCLAVLAKACVEDDPLHRPSTDDIMKVLARMV